MSSGASRTHSARCSISSSSGSSAQWMSSKTSTSGCSSASCSAHSRTAHGISCGAPLALERVEHARGEPEQVGDGLVLAADPELLRLLGRVVVGDAGRGLHHLGERPVGDALAVRQAAADEDGRALERGDELAREAALADARLAVERDQVCARRSRSARSYGVAEELQLALAADEAASRRGVDAPLEADDAPGFQTGSAAAQLR